VKWKLAILRRRFKDLSWQWNGTSGMLKTIYKFVYCNIYYIIACRSSSGNIYSHYCNNANYNVSSRQQEGGCIVAPGVVRIFPRWLRPPRSTYHDRLQENSQIRYLYLYHERSFPVYSFIFVHIFKKKKKTILANSKGIFLPHTIHASQNMCIFPTSQNPNRKTRPP
jgi:hypothetical protein